MKSRVRQASGVIRIYVDCDCPHCSTKDWESVWCICGHTLGAHSTNGPWCEECDIFGGNPDHSFKFGPAPALEMKP